MSPLHIDYKELKSYNLFVGGYALSKSRTIGSNNMIFKYATKYSSFGYRENII